MATSLNHSVNMSEVILDLDKVTNIGHPCWELLQPNPDIHEMFDEYNNLFFGGILNFRVVLDWHSLPGNAATNAGATKPPENVRNGRMSISLNKNLLVVRSRRETIEILLHEMIHAYLIHIKKEDRPPNHHGPNFQAKMNAIRAQTGLNITINHDFTETTVDKYYKWRCLGNCRNMAPYFGFIWVKGKTREPSQRDLMWINREQCDHQFERYGDNPKEYLTHWDCIIIFNKFVSENKIRIKTKKVRLEDNNDNVYMDDTFVMDINTAGEDPIANKYYVNFDRETKQFINVDNYLKVDTDNSLHDDSRTVCMICLCKIADEAVIQHLEQCTAFNVQLASELTIAQIQTFHLNSFYCRFKPSLEQSFQCLVRSCIQLLL
ncbi:DNA-dependent metalloprotease SPRTN-like [Sitodiplosis mosellana]|uniref:DNA-dependent metalloprotease SPRTN-like n=1 Tax=Sitodiplosis mosellana TaxID=263140 RepID=UPI0024451B37|nr:DNA-dependent metalloprotease SPRTN-like [Sitodiplosis mosellana]